MGNPEKRWSKREWGLGTLGFLLLAQAAPALAADDTGAMKAGRAYIGPEGGLSILSDGGGSNFGVGATAGYGLTDNIGVGAFFTHVGRGSLSAAETGGLTSEASVNYYGLEGNYFLSDVQGLSLGVKLGFGNNSVTINNVDNSNTDFYYGPRIGYDFSVGSNFSLGAEANVLFTSASGAKNSTNVLGVLKYWFG